MTKQKRGIMIEVSEDRYDIYATPGSKRELLLAAYVQINGGINHSVKPGLYEFKIGRNGLKFYTSLMPWEGPRR